MVYMGKITHSAQETQKLGQAFGNNLIETRLRQGYSGKSREASATIIALYGELGSGKTTFVQGLAKSLGLPDRIVSPTFIISKKYTMINLPWDNFYHIDCYRLDQTADLTDLGFSDIFADTQVVAVVEWAEKIEHLLPAETIRIYFKQIDDRKRKITIKNKNCKIEKL